MRSRIEDEEYEEGVLDDDLEQSSQPTGLGQLRKEEDNLNPVELEAQGAEANRLMDIQRQNANEATNLQDESDQADVSPETLRNQNQLAIGGNGLKNLSMALDTASRSVAGRPDSSNVRANIGDLVASQDKHLTARQQLADRLNKQIADKRAASEGARKEQKGDVRQQLEDKLKARATGFDQQHKLDQAQDGRNKDAATAKRYDDDRASAERRHKESMANNLESAKLKSGAAAAKTARLSDKQVAEITSYDNVLNLLGSIKEDKKAIDTGLLANAGNKVAQAFGKDDPKVSRFRAKTNIQLAAYIQEVSGKATTNAEREFLTANMPMMSDNDPTFDEKLTNIEEYVSNKKTTALGNFSKQGKSTDNFAGGSQNNTVRIRYNGQELDIPQSDLQEALNDGAEEI